MRLVWLIKVVIAGMYTNNCRKAAIPSLPEMVEQARQDWMYAQHFYNDVTDSDLIEYAIYLMKAAERKYIYLLKQTRRMGITHSPYECQEKINA